MLIFNNFAVFRSELTDKYFGLEKRLRLFTSMIQPSLLYGSASWTLTRAREAFIKTTQRKMMRAIIGTRRIVRDGDLEGYVDWIVRSTSVAEEAMRKFGVPDWVEEAHKRKFRWAGQVARCTDRRWTREVLEWSATGSRRRGRPVMRWTDSLNKFFQQPSLSSALCWITIASDEDSWHSLEEDYVNFVLSR